MRSFFRDHWKAIVVILLLVVLATFAVTPGAASSAPSLAERLRTHAHALAAAYPRDDGAAYIAATLRAQGYRVRHPLGAGGQRIPGELDASIANVAPGGWPARVFIVGAREDAGAAAAVLELARQLKGLQPTPGTELRFVFLAGGAGDPFADMPDMPDSGSFIAFAGTPEASRRVLQALSAFQGAATPAARGFAAPDYTQGVALFSHAAHGAPGYAMMVTGTAFGRYPYLNTVNTADDSLEGAAVPPVDALVGDDPRDYGGIARVVSGLAHTIEALAAGQQG
jgi:hypothetical protein